MQPEEHIMKIGPIEPKVTTPQTAATERRTQGAGQPEAAEPSAKVHLSSGSQVSDAVDDGSFDKAKVERIANAIREGRFQVDAGAIADKLISNAQELLGRTRN
jgi:negative regulator of flagellin synthesis FlgM